MTEIGIKIITQEKGDKIRFSEEYFYSNLCILCLPCIGTCL